MAEPAVRRRVNLSGLFLLLVLMSCFPITREAKAQKKPPQPRIVELVFEGNETFSDLVLESAIATESSSFWKKFLERSGEMPPLEEFEVRVDVARLTQFYRRRGFNDARVTSRIENVDEDKNWKKRVVFEIKEGLPIKITSITYNIATPDTLLPRIRDDKAYQKLLERHAYRQGRRYELVSRPDVTGAFTEVLKNLGFAHAETNVDARIDTTAKEAKLTIRMETGPVCYIDSVNVEGNTTVDQEFVIRHSNFGLGDRFTLKKIQQAQRLLVNHHMFRFATINIPDQKQDASLHINIRVQEHPLRSIQTLAGFSIEEKVRGQVSWTHRNVNSRGHQFTAGVRASFREQRANIDYLFPYVFNPKSNLIITPFGQHILENSYELLRFGITNSFIYQYNPNVTATAAYEFTRNSEIARQNPEVALEDTLEYNISGIQLSAFHGQQNWRRQRGWVFQPFVELSGVIADASYAFEKVSIDVRRYVPITERLTLAARTLVGVIFSPEQDTLPRNIRFYSGGTNSVRGWGRYRLGPKSPRLDADGDFVRYDPDGGRAILSFNTELRRDISPLIKGISLAMFLDGGQVWSDGRDIGNRPVQFGVGGGIRYQSPLGPVRLDVGYKLNPTEKDLEQYQGNDFGNAFDYWGIHFSIGQAF